MGLTAAREALLWGMLGYCWVALLAVWQRRRQRRLAFYYGLTYLLFFVGCTLFWLNRAGLTNFNLLQPNVLAWTLVLELLVLSALLIGRFRYTLRQVTRLRIRQLRQRTRLGGRLIQAQEEERTQLARELHDALGPNLTALHLAWQGPAVQRALASSPEAAAAGHHTERLLRHLRDEVRALSHTLMPLGPGLNSLAESVRHLTELINYYGQPIVHAYCDASVDTLPPVVQTAAYRITAELLNNALRHAQATEATVQLLRHPSVLEIMVEDDGRGFAAAAAAPGTGLRGIRARTEYLRGEVHVYTSARGTSIVVRLPYE